MPQIMFSIKKITIPYTVKLTEALNSISFNEEITYPSNLQANGTSSVLSLKIIAILQTIDKTTNLYLSSQSLSAS